MNREQQDRVLNDWLSRHKGLLLKVARSFSGASSDDRDDLLQEIVLQVWRSIPGYPPEIAETTWIYRVALYTAVSWSRKEANRKVVQLDESKEPIADISLADPRVEWLYEKIAELKSIDRSLALLLLDGFSYREIAQMLGLSESNVGVRINRLKKQLTAKFHREEDK